MKALTTHQQTAIEAAHGLNPIVNFVLDDLTTRAERQPEWPPSGAHDFAGQPGSPTRRVRGWR